MKRRNFLKIIGIASVSTKTCILIAKKIEIEKINYFDSYATSVEKNAAVFQSMVQKQLQSKLPNKCIMITTQPPGSNYDWVQRVLLNNGIEKWR